MACGKLLLIRFRWPMAEAKVFFNSPVRSPMYRVGSTIDIRTVPTVCTSLSLLPVLTSLHYVGYQAIKPRPTFITQEDRGSRCQGLTMSND